MTDQSQDKAEVKVNESMQSPKGPEKNMNDFNSKSNFSSSRKSEYIQSDKLGSFLNKNKEMGNLKKYINATTSIKKKGSIAPPVLNIKSLLHVREDNSDQLKKDIEEVNQKIAAVASGINYQIQKNPSTGKLQMSSRISSNN